MDLCYFDIVGLVQFSIKIRFQIFCEVWLLIWMSAIHNFVRRILEWKKLTCEQIQFEIKALFISYVYPMVSHSSHCYHTCTSFVAVDVCFVVVVSKYIIRWYDERPIAQILKWTRPISHNAPFCTNNVHTYALYCYKMAHCDNLSGALWALLNGSLDVCSASEIDEEDRIAARWCCDSSMPPCVPNFASCLRHRVSQSISSVRFYDGHLKWLQKLYERKRGIFEICWPCNI